LLFFRLSTEIVDNQLFANMFPSSNFEYTFRFFLKNFLLTCASLILNDMKKIAFIMLFSALMSTFSFGQVDYSPLKKGLKFNLSADGKVSIKLGFGTQIMARYMECNPGVMDSQVNPVTSDADLSLYRTYFSIVGTFHRFTYFVMPALTAQPITSSAGPYSLTKPGIFLYDNWLSYQIIPDKLCIGAGLNMFNGISRLTSSSSAKTLGVDVPVITAPNLITTDQSARQMSIFISGKLGKFDYRLAFAKPFRCERTPQIEIAADISNNNLSYKGYFQYQFFGQETAMMPFYTATYIGEQKILNIGAGFDYHPNATASYDWDQNLIKHDKIHFGADIYLDLPLLHNDAITFYSAFYYFNYGPNYLLNFGTMNIHPNAISEVQLGTGKSVLVQAAYLLPIALRNGEKIQIYAVGTYNDFEALPKAKVHYDVGVNFFVVGHNLKATLEWQRRPIYNDLTLVYDYKNLAALRLQVYI